MEMVQHSFIVLWFSAKGVGGKRDAQGAPSRKARCNFCVPLFLPLDLELGSFILLAFGLAPRPCEIAIEPIGAPTPTDAAPMQADAKRSQTVAKIMQEAAKPAAGTRAYYLP